MVERVLWMCENPFKYQKPFSTKSNPNLQAVSHTSCWSYLWTWIFNLLSGKLSYGYKSHRKCCESKTIMEIIDKHWATFYQDYRHWQLLLKLF